MPRFRSRRHTKALGGGVNELRIQHGPGYGLYFTVRRQSIILLLCGGTKGSQARDIRRAKALEKEMDDEDNTV